MADADDILRALKRIDESLGESRDLFESAAKAHREFCETVLKLLREQQINMEFLERTSSETSEHLFRIESTVSLVASSMLPALGGDSPP